MDSVPRASGEPRHLRWVARLIAAAWSVGATERAEPVRLDDEERPADDREAQASEERRDAQ